MRSLAKILCLALLLLCGTISFSHAQTPLPKEDVIKFGKAAFDMLPNAKIGNGELIGEERFKTLSYPLVPYELTEFVIVRGHVAGFAAACGLDWEQDFYGPLMAFLRSKHPDFNDYQFAYIGLLHGLSMSNAEKLPEVNPCTEEMKAKLLPPKK